MRGWMGIAVVVATIGVICCDLAILITVVLENRMCWIASGLRRSDRSALAASSR